MKLLTDGLCKGVWATSKYVVWGFKLLNNLRLGRCLLILQCNSFTKSQSWRNIKQDVWRHLRWMWHIKVWMRTDNHSLFALTNKLGPGRLLLALKLQQGNMALACTVDRSVWLQCCMWFQVGLEPIKSHSRKTWHLKPMKSHNRKTWQFLTAMKKKRNYCEFLTCSPVASDIKSSHVTVCSLLQFTDALCCIKFDKNVRSVIFKSSGPGEHNLSLNWPFNAPGFVEENMSPLSWQSICWWYLPRVASSILL